MRTSVRQHTCFSSAPRDLFDIGLHRCELDLIDSDEVLQARASVRGIAAVHVYARTDRPQAQSAQLHKPNSVASRSPLFSGSAGDCEVERVDQSGTSILYIEGLEWY